MFPRRLLIFHSKCAAIKTNPYFSNVSGRFFSNSSTPWKEYISKTSSDDIIHKLLRNKAYVNGKWIDGKDKNTFEVVDPASREVLISLPDMGSEDCREAIDFAYKALKPWQKLTANERCEIVHKIYTLLHSYVDPLSRILTAECGKPLSEAKGEITYAASYFKWFAEEGRRIYGDIIPSPTAHRRILVTKNPVGVCGIITPWNFPIAMIARKVAPALATGCSVVIKPTQSTPLSALALAQIASEAGVPPGILNVLTSSEGSKMIGKEMGENKKMRKFSFTGSTKTGIELAKQCATTVKKVSLELGGNAPFIVFEDADVDSAVEGAMTSKFRNSGQTCVCTNRFYLHKKIYNEFVDKFTAKIEKLKIGHGFHAGVNVGPLITDDGLSKVESHVHDAVKKGAEVITGGKKLKVDRLEKGAFYAPTVLGDVSSSAKITQEETFGPVAPMYKFENDEQVLEWANSTDSGLASYFYTKDLKRAFNIAEKLEFGMVGVNSGLISTEVAPFGGIKYSGIGREGSKYGIDEYLDIKYIAVDNL